MSAHMKKHHTSVQDKVKETRKKARVLHMVYGNKTYAIPKNIAEKYLITAEEKQRKLKDTIPANEVFADFDKRYTKAGALLKGVRAREGLSQLQFAKKIDVNQSNLSNMENGKRPIGKTIAKRIEKIFGVNYRYFLE